MSNEIQRLEAETGSTLALAREFEVQSDAQLSEAAAYLRDIKSLQKQIDAAFDPILKAAHDAHKTAIAQKKASMAPLEAAEGLFKRKCLSYTQNRDKALQDAREAHLRANPGAAPLVVEDPAKLDGVSTRLDYDFEIQDKNLVPMAFLMVDEVRVRKLVRQLGNEAAPMLPGIKIVEKQVMSVRA